MRGSINHIHHHFLGLVFLMCGMSSYFLWFLWFHYNTHLLTLPTTTSYIYYILHVFPMTFTKHSSEARTDHLHLKVKTGRLRDWETGKLIFYQLVLNIYLQQTGEKAEALVTLFFFFVSSGLRDFSVPLP